LHLFTSIYYKRYTNNITFTSFLKKVVIESRAKDESPRKRRWGVAATVIRMFGHTIGQNAFHSSIIGQENTFRYSKNEIRFVRHEPDISDHSSHNAPPPLSFTLPSCFVVAFVGKTNDSKKQSKDI